jgi:hypothetical protein
MKVYMMQPYNETVDVYSFGIILWQLAKFKMPFDGFSKRQLEEEVSIFFRSYSGGCMYVCMYVGTSRPVLR